MPLAFESTTHGTVAFGFFNIDSDMLLLENRFFFATDLCELLLGISRRGEDREVRPPYVTKMKEALQSSESWLFDGIDWEV